MTTTREETTVVTGTASTPSTGQAAALAAGEGLAASDLAVAVAPAPHWLRRGVLRGRGLVGLVLVGLVVLLGVLAPVLAPYGPNQQLVDANLLGPSGTHLLGTDLVNRDVFSRVLYGTRVDLVIIAVGVAVGGAVGVVLTLLASLTSATDVALQRVFDVLLSFPALILAIGLTAVLGPGATTVVVVIAVVEVPVFGRILRSGLLTVRSLAFVDAAETLGARRRWVLGKHLLPNASEPLWVQAGISLSVAVFLESAMSFLGIGVRPPDPSLGSLVSDAVVYLDVNPALALSPLAVIVVLVLGLQLLVQGISAGRRA